MTTDAERDAEAMIRLLRQRGTPEHQAKERKIAEEHDAARREILDPIAERLLGVRPEHGVTIYSQHPIMTGVLRQALEEAFEAGASSFAKLMFTGKK